MKYSVPWPSLTSARKTTLLFAIVAVVVLSSLSTVTGGARVQDDWPSECEGDSGPFQNATGTYSGTIDVPVDQDAFQLALERGDFVTVSPLVPEAHNRFVITIFPIEGPDMPGSIMIRNESFEDGLVIERGSDNRSDSEHDKIPIVITETANGSDSTWEIWANADSIVCLQIDEDAPNAAEFPYEWQLRLQKNSPTIDRPGHQVLSPQEVEQQRRELDQLNTRVDKLESRVDEQESRIDELESTVADHEQRIRELEEAQNQSDQLARHSSKHGSDGTGGDVGLTSYIAAGILIGGTSIGLLKS